MADELLNKVLGCIIGATIGDSVGAVVEFNYRETIRSRLNGKEWVEDMHPFKEIRKHPLGVFRDNPPRGTGTDDTRLNQIFLECVVKNKGFINSQLLAIEYIERYMNPQKYYPKNQELGKNHMSYFYPLCCAHLGMREFSGQHRSLYLKELNGFPILSGLLSLQSAGLLFQNNPEKAYMNTVDLDFFDIGYAKDATALLASMISAALSEETLDARKIIEIGVMTNPYELGGKNGERRTMTGVHPLFKQGPSLPRLFEAVDKAKNDREAILALAKECEHLHPFSPLEVLGVPMAIIRYTNGDPARSILMAANHRIVDKNNNLVRLKDVDCVAMVTGTLVGVLNGIDAFPKDWVESAVSANMDVYGFNLEKNAIDFYDTIYQKNK